MHHDKEQQSKHDKKQHQEADKEKQPREKVVSLRVTEDEYRGLAQLAEAQHSSVSDYIRRKLFPTPVIVPPVTIHVTGSGYHGGYGYGPVTYNGAGYMIEYS